MPVNGSTRVHVSPAGLFTEPCRPIHAHIGWASTFLHSEVNCPVHRGESQHWMMAGLCPSLEDPRQSEVTPGFEATQPWVRTLTVVLGTGGEPQSP